MKALIAPTFPATAMVPPLSEIPVRREVSPSITIRPPWAVAPADSEALPWTRIVPSIRFSPTPHPTNPLTVMSGPAPKSADVVAGVAVDGDVDPVGQTDGQAVAAPGFGDQHLAIPSGRARRRWLISLVDRSAQLSVTKRGSLPASARTLRPSRCPATRPGRDTRKPWRRSRSLGDDRRLAGESVANDRKLVPGRDQQRVEAVHRLHQRSHRVTQVAPLAISRATSRAPTSVSLSVSKRTPSASRSRRTVK